MRATVLDCSDENADYGVAEADALGDPRSSVRARRYMPLGRLSNIE